MGITICLKEKVFICRIRKIYGIKQRLEFFILIKILYFEEDGIFAIIGLRVIYLLEILRFLYRKIIME